MGMSLTCAACGKYMNPSRNALPQGEAMHQHCRRRAWATKGDAVVRRRRRAADAPGLSTKARRELLRKWMNRGMSCAYCDQPATTIDHVVPLSRGGTHYEGNLSPCCLSCNSRKHRRLVAEWRYIAA